ncbi:ADP-ribosylglycohydrolase family protein [Synechococcus sp. PCC 6312]|uniref:ADP-ribosylglycohydrolase family protein n=1 Tax=Synechococcus sp. (strain ATCC 27167 / PCC 6312) TaxID=195253 RepID=UPI00029EF5D5|nr:ADP-ribosylglycohydrolase family protein [Synechococcus sp. PCC 6312]AFY60890.1 ADP-ribosylglycohydrolase [Synechococcus sp. PCC 6312]
MLNSRIAAGLLGACVGDALGVPVKFTTRAERTTDPVQEMRGYGTWKQPAGTWSDDGSLLLCLAESLCQGFDLDHIAQTFVQWHTQAHWSARGIIFDIGTTTCYGLQRLQQGASPTASGASHQETCGSGALMRTLPLAFHYFRHLNFPQLLQEIHQTSAITHAHRRSQMACGIYVSIALCLLEGASPSVAYQQGIKNVYPHYQAPPYAQELIHFGRIWSGKVHTLPMTAIRSDGYVISTLEAALWCFLNHDSFAPAVLQAVNLGGDTDTTAAVTGGLAGIYYGLDGIARHWLQELARYDDIRRLAQRLEAAIFAYPA